MLSSIRFYVNLGLSGMIQGMAITKVIGMEVTRLNNLQSLTPHAIQGKMIIPDE